MSIRWTLELIGWIRSTRSAGIGINRLHSDENQDSFQQYSTRLGRSIL